MKVSAPLKCVFWMGATGTGKSDIALQMAEKFSAAIVNADSVQMYRELQIGSAKPSPADFARRPHFLFDVIPYPKTVTAGEFNRLFFEHMEKAKDRTQFVVGGTGFYFQAIEKGVLDIPKSNPEVQARLQKELAAPDGETQLYARLQELDPVAAARIHARDHYRVIRALDVIEATGRSLTQALQDHERDQRAFPYPLLKLGLKMEKDELAVRLRRRTRAMLAAGLVDEVRSLLQKGYETWEPLSSVGYRECVQFLRGEIRSEAELLEKILSETLRLAKKQRTWFQRDNQIRWYDPTQPTQVAQIQDELEKFLTQA